MSRSRTSLFPPEGPESCPRLCVFLDGVFSGGNRRGLVVAAALAGTTAFLGGVDAALAAGDPAPTPPVRSSATADLDGRLGRVLRDAQTAGTGAALKRARSEGVPLEGAGVRVVI